MADIFIQHPKHIIYCANVRGQIYNAVTDKELKGGVLPCGYVNLTIQTDEGQKNIKKHRMVMECLLGRQLSREEHVHHKSRDKLDNSQRNLEVLTPAEHAFFFSSRRRHTRWFARPVVRISEDGDRTRFASCAQAAKAFSLLPSNLPIAIRTGRRFGGFIWEFEEAAVFPDLEGEEWRRIEGTVKSTEMQVSSKGRVRGVKGVTCGHKQINGYSTVSVGGKNYLLHRLVCIAFHGSAPNGMTVDHIDRNPGNNSAENLRWATGFEQIKNRCKKQRT